MIFYVPKRMNNANNAHESDGIVIGENERNKFYYSTY